MVKFKVRCSQIGALMTNPRSKSEVLSVTTKTVAEEWMKQQLYDRYHSVKSKYTEKGNECELESIKLINKHYGWSGVKNELFKENEYITGTCDVLLDNRIIDVKNSWSEKTFPLFDAELNDKAYFGQGQGYMELYGRDEFSVIYTLNDAPEHLIEREAWVKCRELGLDELDFEIYSEVQKKMTYSNLPNFLRIKRFDFTKDSEYIQAVNERVELVRNWIENETNFYELLNKLQKS